MNKFSLSALVAAGLLAGATTSATAADLGGNCCADLEERIAELEATTARKGNRKVSLTISGWVAEQVVYWDDGAESNVYVGGIGSTLASHFKLTGQAAISPGWSAGYVMHIEAISNEPLAWNAETSRASGTTNRANVLQSFWFVKSDTLGKVSVGLQSQASDNTAILVDGSGSLVPANWVIFDGPSFGIRTTGGAQSGIGWGDVAFCHHIGAGIAADCNGVPLNAVRYDSPTFGGFSVSASWGEDDFWDIAARYAGEHQGIKLAVAAAYSENTDENVLLGNPISRDSQYFQIGAYVQHMPTGLFLYGAYGDEQSDNVGALAGAFSVDSDHWYLKAGIRTKLNPLGATVFYGEYAEHQDMASELLVAVGATGTEMQRWGLGVVQEVDAAAMSVWLKYRNMSAEVDGVAGLNDLEDLDFVGMGALINF